MSQLLSPAAPVLPRIRRPAIGLGLVMLVQLMLILDLTVVNVALPQIRGDLGFSTSSLSWVLNGYTLTFGGLLLLGGRIGDVLGRRRTFLAGVAVFTLGSLLGGLAPTAGLLVAARALQGVGAAVAAPNVLALISTSAETPAARNRALALFSAVSSAGGSLGLLLGGALTGYASWRWSLFINVPIGLLVLALVPRFVAETDRRPGRFDVPGAVTATLGSSALVLGFIHAADHGWTSPGTVASFAAAVVLLLAFVSVERRASAPVLDLALLRHRGRAGAVSVMALFIGAQFGFFFFSVQFMQAVLGYGALQSGFAFLPLTLLIFATSRVSPRLVGRFGVRPVVLVGLSLVAAANLVMATIDTSSGYLPHLLVPMLLIGVGAGLGFMPLTVAMLSEVAPEHAGTASGLLQMGQQVGGSLGLAVLVTVFASAGTPGNLVSGMPAAFLTGAGFVLAGVVVAAVLLGRQGRVAPAPAVQAPHEEELSPAA
ncbi:MAG TPA: MFS transporter [Nocardioidaceae bacterium]|nr:MFS transporter [Nocardioidaceae bacterium]